MRRVDQRRSLPVQRPRSAPFRSWSSPALNCNRNNLTCEPEGRSILNGQGVAASDSNMSKTSERLDEPELHKPKTMCSISSSCRPMLASATTVKRRANGELWRTFALPESSCKPVRCSGKVAIPRCRSHGNTRARKIEVTIRFHETSDQVTISVNPNFRLSPGDNSSFQENPDDVVSGRSRKVYFGVPNCQDEPKKTSSFKGLISEISGIPVENQRFFCNGVRIEGNRGTLRDHGITHGSTVLLRTCKDPSCKDRDKVVLACTAKKQQRDQMWIEHEKHVTKGRARGEKRHLSDGTLVMPKWQPSSALNYFGPTHRGLDFHGDSKAPVHQFGDYHVYRGDDDDRGLMRIRKGLAYTTPIEYITSEP